MAPLDWDKLMSLNVEELEEDTDQAEDMVGVLGEFDPGDEADADKLKKLFAVAQSLMNIKAAQAEVAEEELNDAVKTGGKSTAKKDQEIEELRSAMEKIKRDQRDKERFGEGGVQGAGREARFMRDEMLEMEKQIETLTKELKDKDRDLNEERQTSARYIQRAEDAEKDLREYKKDNEQLRDDLRDYQRQLDAQRETLMSKQDDDLDYRDKITSKNKFLNAALEENRNLVEANVEFEKKLEELKKELRDGKAEIEKTTDEYLKLRLVVDQSDSVIDSLRRENEMLKDQIDDLMDGAKSKADADDAIMVQVNNKVEEWKDVLASKEDQILVLKEQIIMLNDQINASNIDSEKASIAMLTKALEERDTQINTLKRRLEDVVGDMDMNAALMEDVRGEIGKAGKGNKQVSKIATLQSSIRFQEGVAKEAESRAAEAENDARLKDKELNHALERLRKMEAGEYGLPEAVEEIKALKNQHNMKDRQIEELTRHINKCEMQINDLYDECDELRERLGMDPKEPLDLSEFKKKKGVRMQEERALNRILQKEIENLEEERITLKQHIRKLAAATGQRAVALGLDAEDMVAIDNFVEDLKDKRKQQTTASEIKTEVEKDELRIRNLQLDEEVEQKEQKLERLDKENAELKAVKKELENENKDLTKGLREIHESLKEQGTPSDFTTLQCPTLDRMLAAIDAKALVGNYDTTLYLKAQVDNLTGHNEELRKELREIRYESTKARVELERATEKNQNLEADMKTLKQAGAGGFYQTMPLPEGMAITSADVIASLNEHLVQVLQEVSLKEEMIEKMEAGLENYRRKFAVMRHQQGLLYGDYTKEKQEWNEEMKKIKEELSQLQGSKEDDMARIAEFDRLLGTLSQDDVEVRRRLADCTRKITVLRVNEKALTRRYNAMTEIETSTRKENTKLKTDMINMETAVKERLGYLQRHKDMATFKIAYLQKQLEDSVPEHELDRANRQYTELTEKYRDLLEKSNTLVAKSETSSGFEIEAKRLTDENNYMKKELQIEKEKLHTLEAAFDNMRKQGMASSKDLRNDDVTSISRKITMLEMKELNERQRAEHSSRMYTMQKTQLRDLEDRNLELEQKFAELTRTNLEQQREERQLRDQLAECVTKEVSDADRKKIYELEKQEANLKIEISKLKEISEVATSQVRAYETHQQSRDKEVTSLRQQLLDFQQQSDEKTVIGRLHRHIVQLQISEGTSLKKLGTVSNTNIRLEANLLRLEQRIDDKDQTIYHNRQESNSKSKHLKRTIHDMRRKFAGAVPLPTQEKFAQKMIQLEEDKAKIEEDLRKTHDERIKFEDKIAELELQHKGLQDLIATLKDGKGAQKVAEWHGKMEQVRLEDLKYKRDIERLKHQIKFHEGLIKKHEVEMQNIEEDKVKLAREFEERELEWEHREVELERIIVRLERQQSEIAGAAHQFESAVGAVPDPSLPVPQQLEIAITTIKKNVKLILDAKAEMAVCKKSSLELEKEVRERERDISNRDKLITELRLRLPASRERDEAIIKATAAAGLQTQPTSEDYESKQAVKVAQSTVASLQARIAQKEETLHKYQELLKQAREDMQNTNRRHEEEMRQMQQKLHNKNDAAFSSFKKNIKETLSRPLDHAPTNEQLKKLNEYEDIIADQDNALAALREKLTQARKEIQDWKYKFEDGERHHAEEKESIIGDHAEEAAKLKEQLTDFRSRLHEKQKELELIQDELEIQKEANTRAPTTTMKNMIERLKNDLALKDKQHKALSKALMDLRADMVTQAEDEVRNNVEQNALENNVQKIVSKQTKEYQERIEELETMNQKLKREVKKRREKENTLNTELEETRTELRKKESAVKKLKEDKGGLEGEVEELERKVERMGTMSKQKGPTEAVHHEIEELRRKNRHLNEELRRQKHQPEKPYEQTATEKAAASEANVAKWEENKKTQKALEKLRQKLKEKETEAERLLKTNEMTKNALDRANKDKQGLEAKLRTALQPGLEKPLVAHQTSTMHAAPPPRGKDLHNMEELRKKNYQLQEENTRLKREQTMNKDAAFQEVQLRNKFLTDKLESMENEIARRHMSASQDQAHGSVALRQLAEKEHSQQKQILKLSEENLELRFEVEQAKKDIPRLKERIEDLQKYVEILKTEKQQLQEVGTVRSQSSISSSLSNLSLSNIRRIGESGKSQRDLEKTIALLKKVVERVQQENEQLKKAPGVVTNETLKVLQLENQGLKGQLEELRQKMGATLSERYVSQQKGTAKIMSDHEKLRRDLMKEMETNEKLRITIKQREISIRELQKELSEMRNRMKEGKKQSLSTMDSGEWKANVLTKLNEEKMRGLEEETQQKSAEIAELKFLLREASEKEQHFEQENNDLRSKVTVLEEYPPGAKGQDSNVVKQYQVARLTIDRLENEKKELINELKVLRRDRQVGDEEDIVRDLRDNNALMRDAVDLRTQLKASELERDKFRMEVEKLRLELGNFGPDFFEEIEDLKYNYQEAVQRNVQYEEQLTDLSKQFGINIPGIS